jgi:hypothetical protein
MLLSGRQPSSSFGELAPTPLPLFQPLPGAMQSWQEVHHLLAGLDWRTCALPEVLALSTYHYCVYKAFGQAPAAALAQRLLQHGTTQLAGWRQLASAWPSHHLDQACSAAWLGTRLSAEGLDPVGLLPLLADLDPIVQQQAIPLSPATIQPKNFAQVLRYFSLRWPVAVAEPFLSPLLGLRPSLQMGASLKAPLWSLLPLPLGLADGLAAELRTLIGLHQVGQHVGNLAQQVRQGIRYLLDIRQEVDFLDQKYSVFPSQVEPLSGKFHFEAALGWPYGDLGQALLLYEAYHLLQDSELADIAELVGLNTLLRITPAATEVTSAQLYRGAAGAAHLYYKLYQASGQPAYQVGQQFWLSQTQDWLNRELANGFYQQRTGQLQRGLVGVGLVLLSAITEVKLDWDAGLL